MTFLLAALLKRFSLADASAAGSFPRLAEAELAGSATIVAAQSGQRLFKQPSPHFFKELEMNEGTIKRLTDKGFGFIDAGKEKDLFFHSSSLDGVSFDDLREGQRVTFTEGRGPKGPCAENVRPA